MYGEMSKEAKRALPFMLVFGVLFAPALLSNWLLEESQVLDIEDRNYRNILSALAEVIAAIVLLTVVGIVSFVLKAPMIVGCIIAYMLAMFGIGMISWSVEHWNWE